MRQSTLILAWLRDSAIHRPQMSQGRCDSSIFTVVTPRCLSAIILAVPVKYLCCFTFLHSWFFSSFSFLLSIIRFARHIWGPRPDSRQGRRRLSDRMHTCWKSSLTHNLPNVELQECSVSKDIAWSLKWFIDMDSLIRHPKFKLHECCVMREENAVQRMCAQGRIICITHFKNRWSLD